MVLYYTCLIFELWTPLLVEDLQVLDFVCLLVPACCIFMVVVYACLCIHAHTTYTYRHIFPPPPDVSFRVLLMEIVCLFQYAVYSSDRQFAYCNFAMALHLGTTLVGACQRTVACVKKCRLKKFLLYYQYCFTSAYYFSSVRCECWV